MVHRGPQGTSPFPPNAVIKRNTRCHQGEILVLIRGKYSLLSRGNHIKRRLNCQTSATAKSGWLHHCSKRYSLLVTRVAKTPSARQQCWPESFCKSGKFLRQVHYWLKNFRILCITKYPGNMQIVRMNWKVFGQSKRCLDDLENVSGWYGKCLGDLKNV